MVTRKDKLLVCASSIAGGAVWIVFDALGTEPWDEPYGAVALLAVGFLFGYLGKEHPVLWTLGIFAGQALFGFAKLAKDLFFYSGGGANLFFPLGLLFLVPFTVPALIGAFAGAALARRSWSR